MSDVRPKDGYDTINWDDSAQLIWGSDLEVDNTILLRLTVPSTFMIIWLSQMVIEVVSAGCGGTGVRAA